VLQAMDCFGGFHLRGEYMTLHVGNLNLLIEGTFPKILKLKAEYFEWVEDPHRLVSELEERCIAADLFTFVQKGLIETIPKFEFYYEWDSLAVLPLTTYENWWKNQIKTQERNRVRKSHKTEIDVRLVEFNLELMEKIKDLYDESPIRQGKPFLYYQKSIKDLWDEHHGFPNKSQFIGAFHKGELIGFTKVVHDEKISYIMKLIATIRHRNLAPANALLAKTVEICAGQGVNYLVYSTWCRRGLGAFKRNHAFMPVAVPRYFVPLNIRGKIALRLKMHRRITELLPPDWVDFLAEYRNKLNTWIFSQRSAGKIS
jgi:hypothetical protein